MVKICKNYLSCLEKSSYVIEGNVLTYQENNLNERYLENALFKKFRLVASYREGLLMRGPDEGLPDDGDSCNAGLVKGKYRVTTRVSEVAEVTNSVTVTKQLGEEGVKIDTGVTEPSPP